MRLIHIYGLTLEEFFDPPPYAILSHRWLEPEITYEQFISPAQRTGPGYEKISKFCALLRHWRKFPDRSVDWAWVDTCCIDKRSSAELSEAINSMWQWYWHAKYCIVWLSDVQTSGHSINDQVRQSEWLTRGWTLQEMLAPQYVYFFDKDWQCIGSRQDLRHVLSLATKVPGNILDDESGRRNIESMSVAQRMSWASHRVTTRPEDRAYCLFGLFGVNLPLLYGEGTKSFIRLQEEIIRSSNDESIFAWKTDPAQVHLSCPYGLLATSPHDFRSSDKVERLNGRKRRTFMTNTLIEMKTSLSRLRNGDSFLELNCAEAHARCLLVLSRGSDGVFTRKSIGLDDQRKHAQNNLKQVFETEDFEVVPEEIIHIHKNRPEHGNKEPGARNGQYTSWLVL